MARVFPFGLDTALACPRPRPDLLFVSAKSARRDAAVERAPADLVCNPGFHRANGSACAATAVFLPAQSRCVPDLRPARDAIPVTYLFDYDLTLLGVAIAWLAVEGIESGFLPFEKSALVFAFLAPIAARIVAKHALVPLPALLNLVLAFITFHANPPPLRRLRFVMGGHVPSPNSFDSVLFASCESRPPRSRTAGKGRSMIRVGVYERVA